MVKIFIQGIKDGLYEIDQHVPVEEVKDIYPEFFGEIHLTGKLRKFGNRYTFTGAAECSAKLVCDVSVTEYEERIAADINVAFLADSKQKSLRYTVQNEEELGARLIGEDDKFIDISEDVREELAVNIPLKKVAPRFRDKSFEELHPEFSPGKEESKHIDERWSVLNKLKIN